MKTLFFISLPFLFAFANLHEPRQITGLSENLPKCDATKPLFERNVDMIITSTGGCEIRIKGLVTFTVIPPKITGFTGTVSGLGGGTCPSFTLTFDIKPGKSLVVVPNTDDPCSISNLSWRDTSGNAPQEVLDALNSTDAIVRELQTICE